jgi:hypothetical protein
MKKNKSNSGGLNIMERLRQPERYESVRPSGFEKRITSAKDEAIGEGVRGAGSVLKEAGKVAATLPMGGVGIMGVNLQDAETGVDNVKNAVKKYRRASTEQDTADREMEAQDRRESRGMKSGGSVGSASKRADGIAQRGKTRGKMC